MTEGVDKNQIDWTKVRGSRPRDFVESGESTLVNIDLDPELKRPLSATRRRYLKSMGVSADLSHPSVANYSSYSAEVNADQLRRLSHRPWVRGITFSSRLRLA